MILISVLFGYIFMMWLTLFLIGLSGIGHETYNSGALFISILWPGIILLFILCGYIRFITFVWKNMPGKHRIKYIIEKCVIFRPVEIGYMLHKITRKE